MKKLKVKKEKGTGKKIEWTRKNKLLVMVAVFLLLLGCYFLITTLTKDEAASDDTSVVAFSTDKADITAVSFQNSDSTIAFSDNNGTWQYDSDDSFPLDTSALSKALTSLTDISATRELTDVTDFSDYGLDNPTYEVKMTSSSDGDITLDIGDENALTSDYYLRVNGGSSVYLVSSDVLDEFDKDLMDFVQADSIPSLTDVSSLTFDNTAQTTFVHYAKGYDGCYTDKYTWFVKDGDTLTAADTSDVKSLVSTISGLSWSKCVAYNVSGDDLATYGLADPAGTVSVDYTETAYTDSGETNEEGETLYDSSTSDKTFTLLIGDSMTDSDGTTYYYAKTSDSNLVYLISSDTATTLLGANASTCPVWDLCKFERTELKSVDITYGDTSATLKVSHKTKDDKTTYTYKIDGEKVDGASLLDDLNSIEAMKQTDTPEDAEGDVGLTLTFHLDRTGFETMTMTFQKYNDDYYLVSFNGESDLLLSTTDYGYITDDLDSLLGIEE